jgi:PAS domain S-box-containing protein
MPAGDLTGRKVGRFRLGEQLGQGSAGSVYRGVPESGGGQEVAIKVLDSQLLDQPAFLERFTREIRTVAGIRHPHLLRLYEYGSSGGVRGLAMELARGGTLQEELRRGPVSLGRAIHLMAAIASALDAAHEAGLVHRDVKPTNILLDDRREPKIADFGLARPHFTYAVGTPGYMAPELALGQEADRRCDVYSLAVLAFEMLTGSQPYGSEVGPNRIVATVMAPVPQAWRRRPDLPREMDDVFMRALAKSPDARHPTTRAFVEDLNRALRGEAQPAGRVQVDFDAAAFEGSSKQAGMHAKNGQRPDPDAEFKRAGDSLIEAFETALSAAVVVDQTGFIVGWNSKAEELFGWSKEEMIGRSVVSTIVPPRHREAHDRGFKRYRETGEGPLLRKAIEMSAMHSDGREFPIELSISPVARSGSDALLVGSIRDITKQKNAEHFLAAQVEVKEVLRSATSLESALPRIFHSVGTHMDWSTGTFWSPEGDRLVCRHFWKADGFQCPEFEQATLGAEFRAEVGLAGRVWSTGDPAWVPDVLDDPTMTWALPALRAGLRCAIAFPVLESGEVRGVVELLGQEVRKEDDELLMRFFDIGRRLGRLKTAKGAKVATLSQG